MVRGMMRLLVALLRLTLMLAVASCALACGALYGLYRLGGGRRLRRSWTLSLQRRGGRDAADRVWLRLRLPPFAKRCPHCRAALDPERDEVVCPHCYRDLVRTCPACGETVGVRRRFCPRCQAALPPLRG